MTKKPRGRPPALKMPDPINATPVELARAICRAPPKPDGEWRFLQPGGDGYLAKKPKRLSKKAR